MYTGFKHLHVTVVVLFLLLFIYKTILLLLNKNDQLDNLRAKTKIADMVLGSLMLVTGGYLLYAGPGAQPYHYLKIIAALASIPLGIVSFKKRIKPLAIFTVVLFIYLYGVAETKSLTFKKEKITIEAIADSTNTTKTEILDQNTNAVLENGKLLYNAACASCHGADGKLGLTGASDLTATTFTHSEKVAIITDGKGNMTPFRGQLSEQDIEAVATYVDSMKK